MDQNYKSTELLVKQKHGTVSQTEAMPVNKKEALTGQTESLTRTTKAQFGQTEALTRTTEVWNCWSNRNMDLSVKQKQ